MLPNHPNPNKTLRALMRRVRLPLVVALLTTSTGLAGPVRAQAERPELNSNERDARLSETYRKMLAEDPGQEYAFRRLLETAHSVGGLVGLIDLYRQEVDKNPKSYASWLVLGQLQGAADQTDALASWKTAADLKPAQAEPHLFTAAFHRHRRVYDDAFVAYERGIGLLKDKALKQEALRAAAEMAIEAKALDKARDYFERLIKTEPNNLFLRMQEASTWSRLDQTALALERWREIEKAAGGQLQHLVIAWREVAELEALLGRFSEAEATWRRGLAKLPQGHYERRTYLEGLVSIHRRQDRLQALVPELETDAVRDVETLIVLARVLEELGQDDAALARYREAQRRKPGDEDIRMAALRLLERIGKPEEVLQAWVELVRAFPREPRYELKLAELFFQAAKGKEAGELLKRISRSHPQDPSVHLQVVDLWMRYGDKDSRGEVETEYKLLMKLEPEEPSHVMSLGEYYWSIEDRTRALSTWQRLQKMGGKKGEGRFLYAEALFDHDLFAEALVELTAALELAPDNERIVRSLALLHEKMGRRQDALAAWQKLVERSAGAARTTAATREAREHIIELWDKDGRLETEIAGLQRRFSAEPPDLGAGRFLAVALLRLGRVSEARSIYERLDELLPQDHETLTGLEQVYTRQSDNPRVMEVLERLAKASPRAAIEYLHRAAELALSSGDENTARKLARQIVEAAPAEASAYTRVGDLYARMDMRAEAAEAWRNVLNLEPRNMAVRFKLASLYRDQGLDQREEQVLTEIVRETNDSTELMRAGRRLLQVALVSGRLESVESTLRPLIEAVSRPESKGKTTQLRLVLDVYGYLAQNIRYGPLEGREQRLTQLGERAQRPLVQALEDADIGLRTRALEIVELTHPGAATGALGRLAADTEQSGHLDAMAALGKLGTSGAVNVLTRLTASTNAATRELALWALGRSSSPQAGLVLVERARRGPPRERLIATIAIGMGRHQGTAEVLTELARDTLVDVREAGLWAVARSGLPEQGVILAARLERATTLREATIAARGLARMGSPSALQALVGSLWTGNPNVPDELVWEALGAHGEVPDPAEEGRLEQQYRGLVIWERGTINTSRPQLFMGESREGDSTRGRPQKDALIAPIAARINDVLDRASDDGRRALAQAMAELPGPDLFEAAWKRALETSWAPLLKAATDIDLRAAIWSGLLPRLTDKSSKPPPEAASQLLAAARAALAEDRQDPRLARAALGLLSVLRAPNDDTADLARVSAFTTAPQAEVRAAAARALVTLGDASAILPLLFDPSPLVRIATSMAIAEHRVALTRPGLEALVTMTRDPLPDIGVAAVRALLAQPGGTGALPADLARQLEDPPPHIARALARAL